MALETGKGIEPRKKSAAMTIISASYKTDIPAFYGEWFEGRLKEGFAIVQNPFNQKKSTVSLKPDDVDGFVFWTRNIEPFLPRLENPVAQQYRFYIQYTVTGYPRILESSVPDRDVSIANIERLAGRFGSKCVVWRYDPILISSMTPATFHLENFQYLSSALKGKVDEVVVSFAQYYKKTQRNLQRLSKTEHVIFHDPGIEEKRDLLQQIRDIALSNDQHLTLCTQPDLIGDGFAGAECISTARLGLDEKLKIQGNRKGCLCVLSKDIGSYDSCPHGCVYCYAVSQKEKAKNRFKNHSPNEPLLDHRS